MKRRRLWISIAVLAGVALALGGGVFSGGGNAVAQSVEPTITIGERVAPAEFNGDLRDLPQVGGALPRVFKGPGEGNPNVGIEKQLNQGPVVAPVAPAAPSMPAPTQSFEGLQFSGSCGVGVQCGAGWPPDTVGDVGPNHYIQAVNTSVGIYNKLGTQLAAFTFDALWAGSGTACENNNNGDPTVIYDPLANRFIVADFAWAGPALENGPYYECIAVSKTGDPVAGGWWLYPIRTDDATHPWLADYPKMGIWPDGLYMTANMFDCTAPDCSTASYKEVRIWAFDRVDMEAGLPVDTRIVDLNTTSYFSLQPSHVTGALPPAGRDNLLVAESQTAYEWQVWKFNVDYVGAGTTFSGPDLVSQTAYPCCAFPAVPTPGNAVDSLADRVMMQNQYKNILGNESLWVSHTVPVSIPNGPEVTQWAQINVTGGAVSLTPVQQQIYNLGDGENRWMGSLAVDRAGNMALGYSVANANNAPDIRYSGRLAGDPPGTLAQGEAILINANGSPTNVCGGGPCGRWGDYSAMTLDPDGCTFWYTTEYYAVNGGDWHTRIGSFKYPTQNCNPPTAVKLARFDARRTRAGVVVAWRTASEAQTLGFNVFRSETMKGWRKVNRTLIAAKGQAGGAAYRLVDRTALRGHAYNYRLQIVAKSGAKSWHTVGAVSAAR